MLFLRRAAAFILVSLFSLTAVFGQAAEGSDPALELNVEDLRRRIEGEAPEEFLAFTLKDNNVSLFLSGSWAGTLQGNFGFSKSPLGTGFASPETPFLFKQETDITMSLWVNDRWFVEANFLDDSKKNTYRAGYQGLPGEYVQYAGVGNTGLDFPSFPYLDLGGDSPSSFGFYSRLGGKDLNVHTLFRYDAASREERVFYGGRERTFSYVQVENSLSGISFVLPDANIDTDIVVYVEDDEGTLRDSGGRRWRLALPSEYAAGRTQGLVELSIRPAGMVAVSYSKNGDSRPWNSSMGSYSGSAGDFLFEVQQWFSAGRAVNLANYPQCGSNGSSAQPGEVVIGGVTALVVRQPGTFSPFERRSRYEAPSSTSEQTALVRLSNGTEIGGYELVPLESTAASADIPLYAISVSRRGIYELLPQNGGAARRSPETCWPLAAEYPEIYLPGTGVFSGDIGLRFTNYGNAGAFNIGSDVVSGSIQVYRSGILDTNFSYNPSSGEVTLRGPAGANELIRITYLKQSDETRLGSLAAGVGAVYRKGKSPFSVMAALGIRWNLTEDSSYTEEDSSSQGTVGFSAKTAWDYDNLNAHIAAGFALQQTDTTGLYRAAGMEGNETIMSLPPETSFLSHPPSSLLAVDLDVSNRASLVYRNYVDNSVLGSTLMPIDWNGSTVISSQNRPYPAKDPQLNEAQALVAEFTLNDAKKWTGFQVPITSDSIVLSRAGRIEIPYRFYGFNKEPIGNFRLIVQIGSLSGKDFAFNENPDLIWEQELFAISGAFDTELRIARFTLKDEDRIKLGNADHLRVIAVFDGIGDEISGRVIISPPIVSGAAFRAVTYDGSAVNGMLDFLSGKNRVRAVETLETSPASLEDVYGDTIKRLHSSLDTQRILKVEWEEMEPGISAGIDGRIGELPLADYKTLSFFVKAAEEAGNSNGTLRFVAAAGPDSINESMLEAQIPLSAFTAGQWSKVTIRYNDKETGVNVGGSDVADATLRYKPALRAVDGMKGKTGYIALFVNPQDAFTALENADIYIDEIILQDAIMVYRMNFGAAIQYRKPGTMLSIRGKEVLADFSVSNAVESEFRTGGGEQEAQMAGSVVNRTGAEISLLGAKVTANMAFTAAKDTFEWSADHGISKAWGPFSVKETFFASPRDKAAWHNFDMGFDSQFYAKFNANANYEFSRLERKWVLGTGYKPKRAYIPSIGFNMQAAYTSKDEQISEDENYGRLWARSWRPLVPDSGEGADGRKTSTQIVITEAARPVGAVVTLEGSTNFSLANNLTALQNSAFLDVPVVIKSTTLNFRAGRKFNRHLSFSGDDALADAEKFFQSMDDMLPLWGVFPGYSLFADELNAAMDKTLEKSSSSELAQFTSFNDHFSIKAGLPSFYNPLAFVVPASASLRLERILEQKLDTRSDMLNFGFSLGYSAVNMFGRLGYLPLFKFYQTDEYTQALETAIIFPRNEDMTWRVQSVTGAAFNGFLGARLNFVNTLILRSGDSWIESVSAEWTIPAQKTLLGAFYEWIRKGAAKQDLGPGFSSLFNSNYEKLRKETLELVFDGTTDYMRWSMIAGHESIIRIQGRLNLSTFVKLRFTEETQYNVFTFDALIGTTLRLIF